MAFPTLAPQAGAIQAVIGPSPRSSHRTDLRRGFSRQPAGGHTLSLEYKNITDTEASRSLLITTRKKELIQRSPCRNPSPITQAKWSGIKLFKAGSGVKWRYAGPSTHLGLSRSFDGQN